MDHSSAGQFALRLARNVGHWRATAKADSPPVAHHTPSWVAGLDARRCDAGEREQARRRYNGANLAQLQSMQPAGAQHEPEPVPSDTSHELRCTRQQLAANAMKLAQLVKEREDLTSAAMICVKAGEFTRAEKLCTAAEAAGAAADQIERVGLAAARSQATASASTGHALASGSSWQVRELYKEVCRQSVAMPAASCSSDEDAEPTGDEVPLLQTNAIGQGPHREVYRPSKVAMPATSGSSDEEVAPMGKRHDAPPSQANAAGQALQNAAYVQSQVAMPATSGSSDEEAAYMGKRNSGLSGRPDQNSYDHE